VRQECIHKSAERKKTDAPNRGASRVKAGGMPSASASIQAGSTLFLFFMFFD